MERASAATPPSALRPLISPPTEIAQPHEAAPRGIRQLSSTLAHRLLAGEHFVLWGPTGSGKTTLLMEIEARLRSRPCARSDQTHSLNDITQALERAYPNVATRKVSRRAARARLWCAADLEPAVLLLDDVLQVGTAMKGFLRRLRGGIAGVMLAVDVDSARERARLRNQHLGCETLRMPPLPGRTQRVLLTTRWANFGLPTLPRAVSRALIVAARGRPGWIVACAELARDPIYWRHGALLSTALVFDAELQLRASKRGLGAVACGEVLSETDQ